jgi:hypothetical protein
MKKVVFSLLTTMFIVAIICCDGNDYPVSNIGLKNFSNTGCKPHTRSSGSDDSYFELKATEGNMLYVKHVNAVFNCASNKFDAKVEADGNSITIREYDLTDLEIMMSCQCPFDLGYEIGPLKDGETYSVKVVSGAGQVDPDFMPVTNEVVFSFVYSPTFSQVIVPSQDEIDPDLLQQTTTVYSQRDIEALYEWTTSTNGTWEITKLNGIVSNIRYGSSPSPEPPHSAEDFFKDNLPLTADIEMIMDGWHSGNIRYRQFYKGLPVEQGMWDLYFVGDEIHRAYGHFVPINYLDIVPLISEENAKKIVENYIKESVEGKDKYFYLAIMEFPGEQTLVPYLVYVYKYDPWGEHNYVYVDAKTGYLLYEIRNHGAKPYD